ncbi:MAG TPA: hypothetical protein VIV40_34240 [Kofleriaceae bacterium]
MAGAQPPRAAANQQAKSARSKPPAAKSTTPAPRKQIGKPKAAVKAAVVSDELDAEDAPADKAEPVKPLPVSATALMTQYQRVGRDLMLLRNERLAEVGVPTEDVKVSCAELHATFRTIKLEDAVKTPESRLAAAALLTELHDKIERLRRVALTPECLNNPLAKDCT